MTGETAQQQEPSMEEILASIRRIISEDGNEDTTQQDMGEVVELTEPLVQEEPAPNVPDHEPAPDAHMSPLFDSEEADVEQPFAELPAEPPPAPLPPPPSPPPSEILQDESALIDDHTASQAADAFERLRDTGNPLATSHTATQSTSLEDLVRELLRPVLKEWLDTHLAAIVEAQVKCEMNRIRSIEK